MQNAEYSDIIENLKKRLVVPELGKQLSDACDKNRIFIPTNRLSKMEIPFYLATYVLHERGLRVACDNLGWFIMLFDAMEDIEIITGVFIIIFIVRHNSTTLGSYAPFPMG